MLYKFNGDSPRSLPEYGIESISPGDTVETAEPVEHPDFEPVVLRKRRSRSSPTDERAEVSESTPDLEATIVSDQSPNPELPQAQE